MPIIIRRLLYNLSLACNLIINQFKIKKESNNGIFNLLRKLPNYKILRYIFISSFIIFAMHYVNINLNHIFGLLIITIIIYFLIERDSHNFNDFLSQKNIELEFLNRILFDNNKDYTTSLSNNTIYNFNNKISYLYLNPLVITLLFKIREYSQYSMTKYQDIIFHINNLYKIKTNMNINSNNNLQLFEIAYSEYKKSLNSFQSMIFSLPSVKATNLQFKVCLRILNKLLLNDIYDMKKIILNSNNEVDINYIPEHFFENFIIKPNQNIDSIANEVYNFFI
jgi:hypothetical protein